jgi:hypothetical protein
MLVLIDESGCPGFKFTRGSDPVFGIGMVIFANGADAAFTDVTGGLKARHSGDGSRI